MSAYAYTEDQLVEQPAIGLFGELDWGTVSAMEEVYGPTGTLGRETSGEVVLLPRLRAALEKLNPKLPPEAFDSAIEELTRSRRAMLSVAANREVYQLLKVGIRVSVADAEPSPQPSPKGRGSGNSTPRSGPLPGRGGEGASRTGNHGALGTARPTKGEQTTVRVQVIDWENPASRPSRRSMTT